ncbi:hypothetical protein BDZ97DRAFT_1763847 [Flammula alnicola]|nr:hypothetical protein BDZ97DRAFT_1763847 [Flammula alnicola]
MDGLSKMFSTSQVDQGTEWEAVGRYWVLKKEAVRSVMHSRGYRWSPLPPRTSLTLAHPPAFLPRPPGPGVGSVPTPEAEERNTTRRVRTQRSQYRWTYAAGSWRGKAVKQSGVQREREGVAESRGGARGRVDDAALRLRWIVSLIEDVGVGVDGAMQEKLPKRSRDGE